MKLRKLIIFIGFFVNSSLCLKEGSLTFVIDNTRSMSKEIKDVKRGVDLIMDVILKKKSSQIENMVLVRFNDPAYKHMITTKDRQDLKSVLYNLQAKNEPGKNKDCPEMSLHGIRLALNHSKDNSHLFVFTDASPKDYELTDEVIRLAQHKSSQVVFIITKGIHCLENYRLFDPYYEIAKATFGQVLKINVKTEVKKVLKYVTETCSGERSVLVQKIIPANREQVVSFKTDNQTEYVIVSSSGRMVQLRWHQNQNIDFQTITWLDNFKALKIIVPNPGKYSVTVRGNSETSVIVYGRTNFKFHYGFSLSPVRSLNNTEKNPAADINNQLAILVNDPDQAISVEAVQLLNMNDHVIETLHLTTKKRDFYTTSFFIPPVSSFLIAVIGKGKYSNEPIRRISKTPIQPKIQDLKPMVSINGIEKNYEYNSKLNFTCNVKGYPKPQIAWIDQDGAILNETIIKDHPPYNYISRLTVEKVKKSRSYTCRASNKLGINSTKVVVNIGSPFIVKKYLADISYIAFQKDVELICDITSTLKLPMKITWSKDGKKVIKQISNDGKKLVINKVNIEDEGTYTCKAELLEDGPSLSYETKLKITGLLSPQIEKQSSFIKITKAQTVTLPCKITKGFPTPTRIWQFKEIGSDSWDTLINTEEALINDRTQLRSGTYKCVASNIIGHDEINTELLVEVPPEITSSNKTVYAVELDLVLRIPCDTLGYPKPTVIWKVNGTKMEIDNKHGLQKETLLVINPVTNDSGNYTCEVENRFGSANKTIEAIVTKYIRTWKVHPNNDSETTTTPAPQLNEKRIDELQNTTKYILEGNTLTLDCPHTKDDAVRWFKNFNYLNITGSPLVINKAATTDDGTYSCRVCNYNDTKSYSIKINVGYAPKGSSETAVINKYGSPEETIRKMFDCYFDVKPLTNEVEWTYNGEMIHENITDFDGEINWGIYTCSIKNLHGTAKKTFLVISSDCLLKKSKLTRYSPLILNEDLTWPDIYYNENYLSVPHDTNIKLFCNDKQKQSNYFKIFPKKSEILATCVQDNKFAVDGKIIKIEDLQCNTPIHHVINETEATCFNDNSKLIKVGFEVDEFVKIFDVCVDKTTNRPLYTRVDVTPLYNERSQFEPLRVDDVHKDKCGEGSKCCFGKTKLVNERDVRYGQSQAATFIEINYVPYWRPCDGKVGWHDIGINITKEIEKIQGDVTIWSGASNYTEKGDVNVPRYLWKVIHLLDSGYAFSVVYVNDPTPVAEDKHCEDICSHVHWILSSESIYCCRIDEFQKSFDIPGEVVY